MSMLVDDLPSVLEEEAARLIDGPADMFRVKLKGSYKEALVCTNSRVAIIKIGYMTGNTFGPNIMQLLYPQVTSVDVHTGWNAYLELSTGGVNVFTKRSVTGLDSPQRARNCITIPGRGANRFRDAATLILDRIHAPSHPHMPPLATAPISTPDEMRKLADLFKEGLLTANEFASQKAVILGGEPSRATPLAAVEQPAIKPSFDEDKLDPVFVSRIDDAIVRSLQGVTKGTDVRRAVFGKRG